MSRLDPATAMNGVQSGPWCDLCNRRIDHGDKADMYVICHEDGGWTPRRAYRLDCCPETVGPGIDEVDEAILLGVLFAHGLVEVTVRNRSGPVTQ